MAARSARCGYDFVCYGCGSSAPPDAPFLCLHCGTPRSLRSTCHPSHAHMLRPPESMWHYFPLLPVRARKHVVSMGEGATPLVDAPKLTARFGLGEVRLKNETVNPTGSFKDRQVAVAVSRAVELGANTVAAVSSGNVAAAAAAYAARATIRAVVFMHAHAGAAKIAQASAYGALVIRLDSPNPSKVFDLCIDACARWNWQHVSTAGIYNPFNVEGAKTIAYELYRQYDGHLPDWIVMPVGGGGLLGGIWRGFLDLQRMGLIAQMPRLAGVQAAGCAPLKQAMDKNWSFLESRKHPWAEPKTIAGGIADDVLFDGHTALPALRTSRGEALVADDPEIEEGLHLLARDEGLLCELTSAVVIPALNRLPNAGAKTRVCCLITGSGIKETPYLSARGPDTAIIPPDLGAVEKVLVAHRAI